MMFGNVNLHNELLRAKEQRLQDEFLTDVHALLSLDHEHDKDIQQRLGVAITPSSPEPTRPTPNELFHEQDIERICTRYRLRFLNTKHFKNAIPQEALNRIRRMETQRGEKFGHFKIMAPASAFKLCDTNRDPLLFVPYGDETWQLVHQWGNDLSKWREVVNWPFRNITTLITSLLAVALIITALTPNALLATEISSSYWGSHRFAFFFWITMVVASGTVYTWFAFFGKFNSEAWNESTFN